MRLLSDNTVIGMAGFDTKSQHGWGGVGAVQVAVGIIPKESYDDIRPEELQLSWNLRVHISSGSLSGRCPPRLMDRGMMPISTGRAEGCGAGRSDRPP